MNDESEEQIYERFRRTGKVLITELVQMSPAQHRAAMHGIIDSDSPNIERDDFGNSLTPGELIVCLRCGENGYEGVCREHKEFCLSLIGPKWLSARVARDLAEAAKKR